MKKIFKAPPRSRNKTAIGILKDVAKAILEEPKRYDQSTWISRYTEREIQDEIQYVKYQTGKTISRQEALKRLNFPSCGTTACVAGWVVTLKRDRGEPKQSISERATRILGIDRFDASDLFSGGAVSGFPGTVEHAVNGVKHIENFMRERLGYDGPSLLPAKYRRSKK